MKHFKLKLALVAAALTFALSPASAYDFTVDGLYYDIVSLSDLTCAVTSGDQQYEGDVVVPGTVAYKGKTLTVVSIGERAFYQCTGLTSICIPSTVSSIGASAFSGCTGLTGVTSLNLTPPTLGDDNFTNRHYINIPLYVPMEAVSAYQTTDGWKNFWDIRGCLSEGSLFEVGGLRYKVASLERASCDVVSGTEKYSGTVTIPSSVTYGDVTFSVDSIANKAFNGCTGVTKLIIEDGDAVLKCGYNTLPLDEELSKGLFYDCSIESVYVGRNLSYTKSNTPYPFMWSKGLQNVVIGNKVDSISTMEFSGCYNLTNVTIPNSVTSICSSAFSDCENLTSVVLPNSLTSIGENAFSYCNCLTNISIPNTVTSIGSYAFHCTSLTSLTIPTSVTSIGFGLFGSCYNLTSIRVASGNEVYDSREDCNAIIETATNTLLQGCSTTYIPNTVTSIGNYAFNACYSMTSITIPNSVTSIGVQAFENCSNLTSLTIPNSVTSIGDLAFEGCSSLTSIMIPNSVTSIGNWAFQSCSSLTSLTIPNSVTSIGVQAFYHCYSLTSIRVAKDNEVYDSREDCNAIIETTTNTLLQGCSTTYIPNTVTSIGKSAFSSCFGLTSITIPNSVTSIGHYAFEVCSGLTSITIPNSVTSIGGGAFHDCYGLTSITIPNSVTSIGYSAFHSCSGLTSLIIGTSVSTIGRHTFWRCSGLKSITSLNTTPPTFELAEYNFTDEQYASVPLYVPQTSIKAYKAADVWKNFLRIEAVETSGIESAEADSENQPAAVYDLQGRKLQEPQKGINIMGGKKVLVK